MNSLLVAGRSSLEKQEKKREKSSLSPRGEAGVREKTKELLFLQKDQNNQSLENRKIESSPN